MRNVIRKCQKMLAFLLVFALVLPGVMQFNVTSVNAATEAITLGDCKGYEEGAYAEWSAVEGTACYKAYVSSDGSVYTAIDDELIRQYPTYWRVDTVGLAAGKYFIKIQALDENSSVIAESVTEELTVTNYDRSGFAFSEDSTYKTASGAYNDDGTLKDGAQVIYVTGDNVNTVTATVKGATYTGLQNILTAMKKGDDYPLNIRIIGAITEEDMGAAAAFSLVGNDSYTQMNVTIEGIGEDATLLDSGIILKRTGNVEVRNLGIFDFVDDGVSVDTNNCNIWIHNLDISYGKVGTDSDQVKGDGSVDIKKSQYCTVSYVHFIDSGKCSLLDAKALDEEYVNNITLHHNWFDHSDSRHPRIRNGNAFHIYNNYYDGNSKYGIGVTTGSSAFAEANYFRNCKYPMMSSSQGSDDIAGAPLSNENGGIIKAYGNYMEGYTSYIPYSEDATDFDAYEVSSRTETVPETVVTAQGGTYYSNFDTQMDIGVDADDVDDAKDVPAIVMANAGRVNGGDFTWEFDDETEDTNYSVITELRAQIESYESSLVSVGGTVGSGSGSGSGESGDEETVTKTIALNPSDLATGNITENTVHNGFTLSGNSTSYFTIDDSSSKNYDGITYANRLKTNGSGTKDERSISFTTTGAGTVSILAISAKSNETRQLAVATYDATEGKLVPVQTLSVDGSALAKYVVTLSEANTYYIYSVSSGVNLYYVEATYETASSDETEDPVVTEYTVTVTSDANGSASADVTKAAEGATVTLTATPNSGYEFDAWEVTPVAVTITDNKFTMPAGDVTVKAIFKAVAATEYNVTVTADANGSASADVTKAEEGATVTLTATPNSGYEFDAWEVTPASVTITNNQFVMPASDVTVKAIFASTEPEEENTNLSLNVSTDLTVGTYTETFEKNGFTLYATTDTETNAETGEVKSLGNLIVDTNDKTVDGVSYTQRLKTGGTGNAVRRSVSFATTDAATLELVAVSSSSSAERTVGVGKYDAESGKLVDVTTITVGTEAEKFTCDLADADTYYIYSKSGGLNIYAINVIYGETPEVTEYNVTVTADANGSASASVTKAEEGATVTLTATPNSGYEFDAWEVTPASVTITDNKFTMPAGDVTVKATFKAVESAEGTYVGNVNSELLKFTYNEDTKYISGEIVVVEWVNGVSTVPSVKPVMTFDSTDGTESIEVFVTATGTNTYYFDRLLDAGLTEGKDYVFTVTSGNELNVSQYRSVPIYTGTSSIGSEGKLGTVGLQRIMYKTDSSTGYLLVYGEPDTYEGQVNSVLTGVTCVKSADGANFVSGEIVIVEWIDGVSNVPTTTPEMTFESYDGTEVLPVYMASINGTNTYYFDRNLNEDMDVTKDYIFRITLTDPRNVSPVKSMIATTNYMDAKEGMLWETDTQYVMYKTVAADGDNQLRVYAVNK